MIILHNIIKMNKSLPIYLYGSIKIFIGIFLLFSENITFNIIKFSLGIALIIGAIFAIISAFNRQRKQVQFAYHEMHAFAMLIYGVSLFLFCNSSEKLILFTAFLLVFYSFSEITFCVWLFNLGQKVVFKIVVIRTLLGLLIGAGTITAMYYSEYTLQIFGVMFFLVGINIIFYVPIMKANYRKQ